MTTMCCYRDKCERLNVAIVPCSLCAGVPNNLHHACQAKFEHENGINVSMGYFCRKCLEEKMGLSSEADEADAVDEGEEANVGGQST